jgi:hypothetical protein
MKSTRTWFRGAAATVLLGAVAPVHAQWAVIDVGAIAQLIEQIATLREQLQTAKDQLDQAKEQYGAITGGRGMERLLSGVDRNYLPPDWKGFESVLAGTGNRYSALAADLRRLVDANAVLSPAQMANLSSDARLQLETARRSVALMQATSQRALSVTSDRFDSLKGLVDAIPRAEDQKAILDLQARITAEQTLLQNEQTKLMVLSQATQATELARRQRSRELAVTNIGSLRRLPAMGLNAGTP